MKTCTACGANNRDEAGFCKECGAAFCPRCGASNRAGAKFCARCRAQLADSEQAQTVAVCASCGKFNQAMARFCLQCGKPLSVSSPVSPSNPCPQCGMGNRVEARFCRKCQASLIPVSSPTGPPCSRCGMPNRLDVKFCRQCGNNLLLVVPPRPTGNLLPMTVLQGRYLIVQHIAKGGMSEIYKVQDQRENNRTIAIKELNENQVPLGEREQVMASFRQEAAMLKELEHDNLLHAWEVFEQGGRLYMTMEFLPWQTLEEVLGQASQPLSEDRALDWAAQICDVFSYLHGQKPNKIIYRDLKPGNVMLSPADDIKLIDFGIARFYKPGKKQDTIQFGTEGYAPPEQYGGAQTCEPADIYALGALLHHLLTLRDPTTKPFYFPPIRQLNNKVSRRVEEAIAQAVNSEPDKRFQSAKEMRQALLGTEATSRPSPAPQPSKPKAKPSSQPSKRKAAPSQGKKPPPAASLKVSPRQLTLKAAFAERAQEEISVELAGSSPASVTASPHWLSVSPAQVKTSAETVTVTRYPRRIPMDHLDMQVRQAEDGPWATLAYYVTLWAAAHARLLVPAETEASGQVTIQQDSTQVSVDVTAVVSPTQEQVTLGWLYVAIAMLVEFGLALAVLVGVLTN